MRAGYTQAVAGMSFQQVIARLSGYWGDRGCLVTTPYHTEVGAGTFNPHTLLRSLGPDPWRVAYFEPSIRPTDGRYGENPFRLQHYFQYQVLLKPSPDDVQDLYLESLRALGLHPEEHDIRFVEDDWEGPTLGAWGLGWEVWLDGMEITQFTYFQQAGGIDLAPISVELTYGLERIAMYLQGVRSVYDLEWAHGVTYGDLYRLNEAQWSAYNFEVADTDAALRGLRRPRGRVPPLPRRRPGAAGLRPGAEVQPHLQPARRARRHQRHRAGRVHLASTHARGPRGARLARALGPRPGAGACLTSSSRSAARSSRRAPAARSSPRPRGC